MVVPVLTGELRGAWWRVGSSTDACWRGTYEREKQRAMASSIKPGMVVYDVGANAGFYTLLASRLVGKEGRVLAFEPYAGNVVDLIRHISANHESRCTVIQAAVAAVQAVAPFTFGMNSHQGSVADAAENTLVRVPTVTLDAMIEEYGFPEPDLVKMDIEGGEGDALAGAARLLQRGRARWFIALHGDAQKRRCEGLLRSANYSLYDLSGNPLREALGSLDVDEVYAQHGEWPRPSLS
jgi:FkbM family methyltransferase